jgi:type IV pilus assembly protein PilV
MPKKTHKGYMKKTPAKGFTLIEILLTIVILSVGILAVMTMQIRATRSNSEARKVTESASWVADEFERLMAVPYGDAQLTPGATVTPLTDLINDPAFPETGPYTVSYTVSAVDTPIPNVKAIDVMATWNTGDNRIVSFRYYKADTF